MQVHKAEINHEQDFKSTLTISYFVLVIPRSLYYNVVKDLRLRIVQSRGTKTILFAPFTFQKLPDGLLGTSVTANYRIILVEYQRCCSKQQSTICLHRLQLRSFKTLLAISYCYNYRKCHLAWSLMFPYHLVK